MRWPWRKYVYRTKTGRVLTDADIEALADEAEQGYDIEALAVNRVFNTGEPVYWTEGDPPPDPAGPVIPIGNDHR